MVLVPVDVIGVSALSPLQNVTEVESQISSRPLGQSYLHPFYVRVVQVLINVVGLGNDEDPFCL